MSFGQGSEPCGALLSTGNGDNSPVFTGVYPGIVHKLVGFGRNSGGAGISRCCITYHADLGRARLLGGTIKKSQLLLDVSLNLGPKASDNSRDVSILASAK